MNASAIDRARLAEMYALYGYAVHRRCRRILGNKVDADDAVQEVFIRALRYGHTFEGEHPLPWLYRIAERHCYDVLVQKKRRESEAVDGGENIQQVEPNGETAALVSKVFARCDSASRNVALLYYVEEFSQEEVAENVGLSRKMVRGRLAKFMDDARSALGLPNARIKR